MDQRTFGSEREKAASILRLGTVFSPAAPVNQASLFAGRLQQMQEISDAVNQRGMHAILFGERGIGKTSLTNVLPEFLALAGVGNLAVSRVNCDSTDTFPSLWQKTLREVQVSIQLPLVGLIPQTITSTETLDKLLLSEPSPEDIRYFLQKTGARLLLIVDEFDRLSDQDASHLMADTIKALSDHSVDVTLLIVGVADTVDELLREHQSIDRCLIQVHMPRMSLAELSDILDKSLSQVEMRIGSAASRFITYLSYGLPHYTHLLGLASARAALEKGSLEIHTEHAVAAIQSALHQAQRSIMVSYDSATTSPRQESLFEEVLLACALAPIDELGYFTASSVREPMSMIMSRTYEIPAFARHLDQFCSPTRGGVLEKIGTRRRYRFRFSNPLMQPYVLIRGLNQGLITIGTLEGLRNSADKSDEDA